MTNAGGITSRAAVSVFSGSGDDGRRTSVEAVQRTRRLLGRSSLCSSTVLHSWDALLGLALVYTATVTIFEVAFLTDAPFNTLFWLNRVLDVIFITDMTANFFRPVFDHETGRTISKLTTLRARYLRGWFALDLVSTIPWDLLTFLSAFKNGASLGMLRLLKILKLTKLLRLVKSARVYKTLTRTWLHMNRQLVMMLVLVMAALHWIACFWAVAGWAADALDSQSQPQLLMGENQTQVNTVASRLLKGTSSSAAQDAPLDRGTALTQRFGTTWVSKLLADSPERTFAAYDLYLYAVEYALSVLAMGYGTVIPTNNVERSGSLMGMAVGGALYGYLIGTIATLMVDRNQAMAEYHQTSDRLGMIMTAMPSLSKATIQRSYDYVEHCEKLINDHAFDELQHNLPLSLRREMRMATCIDAAGSLHFFRSCDDLNRGKFLELMCASCFKNVVIPPDEHIFVPNDPADCAYIVTRGFVTDTTVRAVGSRSASVRFVCTSGRTQLLGATAFCANPKNHVRASTAAALTFVSAYRVEPKAFEEIWSENIRAFADVHSAFKVSGAWSALRLFCLKAATLVQYDTARAKELGIERQVTDDDLLIELGTRCGVLVDEHVASSRDFGMEFDGLVAQVHAEQAAGQRPARAMKGATTARRALRLFSARAAAHSASVTAETAGYSPPPNRGVVEAPAAQDIQLLLAQATAHQLQGLGVSLAGRPPGVGGGAYAGAGATRQTQAELVRVASELTEKLSSLHGEVRQLVAAIRDVGASSAAGNAEAAAGTHVAHV